MEEKSKSKYNIDKKKYYEGWIYPSKKFPAFVGDQKKLFDEISEEKLMVHHTYDPKFNALIHWTQNEGYHTKIGGVDYIEECYKVGVELIKKRSKLGGALPISDVPKEKDGLKLQFKVYEKLYQLTEKANSITFKTDDETVRLGYWEHVRLAESVQTMIQKFEERYRYDNLWEKDWWTESEVVKGLKWPHREMELITPKTLYPSDLEEE